MAANELEDLNVSTMPTIDPDERWDHAGRSPPPNGEGERRSGETEDSAAQTRSSTCVWPVWILYPLVILVCFTATMFFIPTDAKSPH